jgi:hypothetical protein
MRQRSASGAPGKGFSRPGIGEGARQLEAGLDQYADIDQVAQLRATQESAELVDEELMRRMSSSCFRS